MLQAFVRYVSRTHAAPLLSGCLLFGVVVGGTAVGQHAPTTPPRVQPAPTARAESGSPKLNPPQFHVTTPGKIKGHVEAILYDYSIQSGPGNPHQISQEMPAPNVRLTAIPVHGSMTGAESKGRAGYKGVTNKKGDYEIELPPGTYRIHYFSPAGPTHLGGFDPSLPDYKSHNTVTVEPGKTTKFDVQVCARGWESGGGDLLSNLGCIPH